MTMIKTNESGRSMIEMLGVLAIIGVLSVGGIAGYSKAMNKYKTNKVADNVSMIVTNIRTLYAQQDDFNGLNNTSAVKMGVVPNELITNATNGTLTNAFLGTVVIEAVNAAGLDANAGTDKAFLVTFGGLSKEACVTLATNDWGSGYSSGLLGISVSGEGKDAAAVVAKAKANAAAITANSDCTTTGYATTIKSATACAGAPMSVTVASKACSCSAGKNTCAISWKYY